jgi:TonB family protein
MTVSFVLHVLVLLWLATQRSAAVDLPEVTEITLLDPGEPAVSEGSPAAEGSTAQAAPAPQTSPGLAVAAAKSVQFTRDDNSADTAPEVPEEWSKDRLDARLATLQSKEAPQTVGIAMNPVPSSILGAAVPAAAGRGLGGSGAAIALARGGSGGSGAGSGGGGVLELARGGSGGGSGIGSAIPAVPRMSGPSTAETPAKVDESTARRTIAGASLLGPIADRAVVSYQLPAYPDWAKREAVEASVTLYFVVRPDGGVKENILVQKTAGFEDFDESARAALRTWQFEPLRAGRAGEQWGIITFHFRLRDVG